MNSHSLRIEKIIPICKENNSRLKIADLCENGNMGWQAKLRSVFDDSGLSMRELADTSGVAYASVIKYLNNKVANPRGDTLHRLAEALGTTEQALRYDEHANPAAQNVDAALLQAILDAIELVCEEDGIVLSSREKSKYVAKLYEQGVSKPKPDLRDETTLQTVVEQEIIGNRITT